MSLITTHVLDTAAGRPAAGVGVVLEARTGDGWRTLGEAVTDDDGRVRSIGPDAAEPGTYRLRFRTAEYFSQDGRESFFPEVTVTFTVTDATAHHHVPLLLSPYAFSTYRGS